MKIKVEATNEWQKYNVKSEELDRIPQVGEQWEISEDKLEILQGNNIYKKKFVNVVETEKLIVDETIEDTITKQKPTKKSKKK